MSHLHVTHGANKIRYRTVLWALRAQCSGHYRRFMQSQPSTNHDALHFFWSRSCLTIAALTGLVCVHKKRQVAESIMIVSFHSERT